MLNIAVTTPKGNTSPIECTIDSCSIGGKPSGDGKPAPLDRNNAITPANRINGKSAQA